MANIHNKSGLTEHVDVQIESYFERKVKVIFADKITRAVKAKLNGTPFEKYPLIGTLSGVPNFTCIFDDPARRQDVKSLYGERNLLF